MIAFEDTENRYSEVCHWVKGSQLLSVFPIFHRLKFDRTKSHEVMLAFLCLVVGEVVVVCGDLRDAEVAVPETSANPRVVRV